MKEGSGPGSQNPSSYSTQITRIVSGVNVLLIIDPVVTGTLRTRRFIDQSANTKVIPSHNSLEKSLVLLSL